MSLIFAYARSDVGGGVDFLLEAFWRAIKQTAAPVLLLAREHRGLLYWAPN